MRRGASVLLVGLGLLLVAFFIDSVDAQNATGIALSNPAGTGCTDIRRRKSWDAYNATEKTLYIAALSDAMKRGYHQKFVELHVEYMSEMEAHKTGVFIYWHRMFLLGYENMLRSLNTSFACITLPVWDHLTNTAKQAASKCTTMQNCSTVLNDLAGSVSGTRKNVLIYNVTIASSSSQVCAAGSPAGSFCGNNTACAQCFLRNRPTYYYPSEALFASVYKQVFTYNDWKSASNAIETGVHNTVHSAIGGIMSYFQSPIDPVFYSHHAFVDALQVIYLKCQLGNATATLSATQKASDSRFWSNFPRRNKGTFQSTDSIVMRTRAFNTTWTLVRTNPQNTLYPFFKDMPGTYAEYIDTKDLGNYSYSYAFSGGLANMYTNCKSSNTIASADDVSSALMDVAEQQGYRDYTDNAPCPKILGSTASDVVMHHWTIAIFEAAKIVGYTEDAANEQMELIMCQHKYECLGGVEDYSDLFRKNFMVEGHPRCYTLIQDLKSGDRVIGVPKWRSITGRFLPCRSRNRLRVTSTYDSSVV